MSDSEPSVVLYDGDCRFCIWATALVLKADRRRSLSVAAIQSEEGERLLAGMDPEKRLESWHLVAPDGGRRSAGDAAAPLLAALGHRHAAAVVGKVPGLVMEAGYSAIASNRVRLSRLVPAAAKARAAETVAERQRGADSRS